MSNENTADRELTQALECSKCSQSFDQVLALQCEHNLCLLCASQTMNRYNKSDMLNSLKCEICGETTVLDPQSASIIISIKQQLSSSFSSSQRPQGFNQQQSFNSGSQQQIPQYQPFQPQNQLQKSTTLSNYNNSIQSNMPPTGSLETRQISKDDINFGSPAYQHHPTSYSCNPNIKMFGDNQQKFQESILFCFSCETPCFTVQNYLNGIHKGHDVKDIRKSYQYLESYIEDIRFKIKTRYDLLLNDQCRLTQKQRDILELVSQSKTQIRQSFEDLILTLQAKERELLAHTDQMMMDQFEDLDRAIDQTKRSLETLNEYDSNFDQLYYRNEERTAQADMRAFNYYAENKNKIVQQIETMDATLFLQLKEQLQFEYLLDTQSVYQHLDSIKLVKIQICALRGLDSMLPANFEIRNFQAARDERNKRRFQSIVKSNEYRERDETNPNIENENLNEPQQYGVIESPTQNENGVSRDEANQDSRCKRDYDSKAREVLDTIDNFFGKSNNNCANNNTNQLQLTANKKQQLKGESFGRGGGVGIKDLGIFDTQPVRSQSTYNEGVSQKKSWRQAEKENLNFCDISNRLLKAGPSINESNKTSNHPSVYSGQKRSFLTNNNNFALKNFKN